MPTPANPHKHTSPAEPTGKRVLMTGVRRAGGEDYELTIFGNAASAFPPLILKMSLHEMQDWLRDTQVPPAAGAAQGAGTRHLRIVSG